ncbi:unnamed protein product [Rhizophagus irregularis]|uniref:Uncharacterized protein n=1 Tax=Rhizophagus irregularis TaxID=588596 RepID=A0A916EE82_9GLOM|nr:unnamed protein product [Rhizophagus irregularis]CAB5384121.1 unnamed protein product [Rhizophagus irregularis]
MKQLEQKGFLSPPQFLYYFHNPYSQKFRLAVKYETSIFYYAACGQDFTGPNRTKLNFSPSRKIGSNKFTEYKVYKDPPSLEQEEQPPSSLPLLEQEQQPPLPPDQPLPPLSSDQPPPPPPPPPD